MLNFVHQMRQHYPWTYGVQWCGCVRVVTCKCVCCVALNFVLDRVVRNVRVMM